MNIFVTKISSATTRQDLEVLFREFGTVDSARIIIDRKTRKSKCFGFVEMPDDTEAMNAINALNETEFQGRRIVVKQANPREEGNRPERNRNSFDRENRD